MKIGFFGTPPFVVEYLKALYNSNHQISFIVTGRDKPYGRGQIIKPPEPKIFAIDNHIPYFQPESLNSDEIIEKIKSYKPDIFIVIAYGKKLPKTVLNIPIYGAYNVHFSLLPRWRGAAPVNWAVLSGDVETGITIMKMDEGLDTGDILLQEKVPINNNETAIDVFEKLIPLGVKLLLKSIEMIEKGEVTLTKQNEEYATYARQFKKNDGLIDWKKSAKEIHNMVRGLQPWPSAFTYLQNKLLKIWKSFSHEGVSFPGKIEKITKNSVFIGTGSGILELIEVQEEGRNRNMPSPIFLRLGYKEGDYLK